MDEVIRSMIMHENQLINDRVMWLLTFQGLVLAALGFAWERRDSRRLVTIFGVFGIGVSVVSAASLIAATNAMHRLYEWWQQHRPADYSGPDVIGIPLSASRIPGYAASWNWFPLLFIAGWIAILWINKHRSS